MNVWGYKARMFALNGPPAVYFHSEAFPSHPDYPLNFPLAQAAFFRFPDRLGLHLAALVSPACLGALILLLYAGLTRLYGSTVAVLGVATLLHVPYVDVWASNLTVQGFIEAAETQATGT